MIPSRQIVRTLLLLAFMTSGCSSSRSLGWEMEFAPSSLGARATEVVGRVRSGGCGGTIVYEESIGPGEAPSMPLSLAPGLYGFEGSAGDTDCITFARGCVEIELPAESSMVLVQLTPTTEVPACPGTCRSGRCGGLDAGRTDVGRSDAPGLDVPATDAPRLDGGFDAGGFDAGGFDAGQRDAPRDGGSDAPTDAPLRELPVGDPISIDFGTALTTGWSNHTVASGTSGPVSTMGGAGTDVTITTANFTDVQLGGSAVNTLGIPGTVTSDTLWLGDFGGHDPALAMRATVTLRGVAPGSYTIQIFASRDGNDGGAGRLTRYTIGGSSRDLEVSDNTSIVVDFPGLSPAADGSITVTVAVSPAGTGRFAYIGAMALTRE